MGCTVSQGAGGVKAFHPPTQGSEVLEQVTAVRARATRMRGILLPDALLRCIEGII
jgi:DNA-binding FrmR family transcriptional regulator